MGGEGKAAGFSILPAVLLSPYLELHRLFVGPLTHQQSQFGPTHA
jgi:hypothetical protein